MLTPFINKKRFKQRGKPFYCLNRLIIHNITYPFINIYTKFTKFVSLRIKIHGRGPQNYQFLHFLVYHKSWDEYGGRY